MRSPNIVRIYVITMSYSLENKIRSCHYVMNMSPHLESEIEHKPDIIIVPKTIYLNALCQHCLISVSESM